MMNDIFIFLGPSLEINTAKQILPQAIYLPPIKCGDILQLLRFQPKALVIIDGFFENTAAVWHKEILLALHHHVSVYGCSSMGAMRAAELSDYGMQGHGEVFEYYKNNFITDDDEVAVLHLNEENNYIPVSEAMITIRKSCEQALLDKIISKSLFDTIISIAKNTFYQQRTLDDLLKKCLLAYKDHVAVEKFFVWYETNKIDIKKIDAMVLLKHLKTTGIAVKFTDFCFNQTSFLTCLYNTVNTNSFYHFFVELPLYEKIVMATQLFTEINNLNKNFSQFLPALTCILTTSKVNSNITNTHNFYIPEEIPLHLKSAYQQVINSIAPIFNLEIFNEQHPAIEYFYDYLKIAFQYVNLKQKAKQENCKSIYEYLKNNEQKKFNMLAYVALAWHYVDNYLKEINFSPTTLAINNYTVIFRRSHNLTQSADFKSWLELNDLSIEEYIEFAKKIIRFDHIIKGNNFEIFNSYPKININNYWLLFALLLTNTYQDVFNFLTQEEQLQQQLQFLRNKAAINSFYKIELEEIEKFIEKIIVKNRSV